MKLKVKNLMFSVFVVSTYNTQYKKYKRRLFNLADAVTLAQLLVPHTCIKV